jgi:hypothetical protein
MESPDELSGYTVKEIGHQWMADRKSIAACADEASALKLIIEDSADKSTGRKTIIPDIGASKPRQDEPAGHVGTNNAGPEYTPCLQLQTSPRPCWR